MTEYVFIYYSLRSLCLANTTNRIKTKIQNPLLHLHIKWEHKGTYTHHIISYLKMFFQILNHDYVDIILIYVY